MSTIAEEKTALAKCQVFTPSSTVDRMLDYIEYTDNLYGKRILENSCGDGQFLTSIAKRYILACRKEGLSDSVICQGLGSDIYGIELDTFHYTKCIANLNSILQQYELDDVEWQIYNRDALREPIDEKFSFIVGNPPYISYWDMSRSERSYVKAKYSVCKFGACDYSYAFIEEGVSRLANDGKFAYIVPNSIFKTKSGAALREMLLPDICAVYDHTTTRLFEGVLTTPAIIVLDKGHQFDSIQYKDASTGQERVVKKSQLGSTWVFGDTTKHIDPSKLRFGDFFNVSIGIATQCNKAFVLSGWMQNGKWLQEGERFVEMESVKKAASPKSKKHLKEEYIIFPYKYDNGLIVRYTEEDYRDEFPEAYKYLSNFRSELDKRDSDVNALWFEYGRSQALGRIQNDKLLMSTLVTDVVHVYKLDSEEVPYSGIFITPKEDNTVFTLEKAQSILQSEDFLEYAQLVGISASGNSIRITPKNICDYRWQD